MIANEREKEMVTNNEYKIFTPADIEDIFASLTENKVNMLGEYAKQAIKRAEHRLSILKIAATGAPSNESLPLSAQIEEMEKTFQIIQLAHFILN